uniref:Reverse transcriptase domain-containing protein n=1 Tax=Trichuris muris TaxID=70415 RepID=A0A5S6Q817_TRIMR
MAAIGNIAAFDVKNATSWEVYAERLEYYCEANNITDDSRKRATLLTVIGSETYAILRSIISPAAPKSKTYQQLVATLRSHFIPQTSLIYRRFLFHKRIQRPDETISTYITELRQLAEECNFGATLTERLRDQLVCGLRDDAIQRRLLAETSLKFDEAVKMALAGEAAANQVRHVQAQNSTAAAFSSAHHVQHGKKSTSSSFSRYGQGCAQKKLCAGCGGQHKRENCKFKDSECHSCHKKGHLAKVCRSQGLGRQKPQQRPDCKVLSAHQIEDTEVEYVEDHINSILPFADALKKIKVIVNVEGQPLTMEVDTGSNFSIISSSTYTRLWPIKGPAIKKSQLQLQDYQKHPIDLLGSCDVSVSLKQRKGVLRLLIAKGNRQSLLGLEWFTTLGLNISGVNRVLEGNSLDEVFKEFQDVFSETLGTYTGPKISLPLNPMVLPKRFKARNVPLAIRSRIEDELNRLLKEGVIEPISNPKWSTPIVPVIKSTGAIRLCGDYKVTINTALQDHPYPIPAVNNLLSDLSGGRVFAKIDMAQAYLQLPVDDATAEAQTIITHRGAFKVKRLQFGVSVAPGIFQQIMDEALIHIPGVTPYFDDVLIRATTLHELTDRFKQVLQTFKKLGLRAKKEKCLFGAKSVDFLGYRIDASGIHPSVLKIEAIHRTPAPQNQKELQAFLGLLNFYNSFLKDKATVAEPLHRLLDKTAKWEWTNEHEESFQSVKKLLTSDSVLVPFDNSLPTTLVCDASPYGVGAVLSQTKPNGQEVTVAFASRTLTTTERNYAQIDKEALAIVAGVKKFHHFLYGRKFTLVTDHKPLLGLFHYR